MRSRLTPAYLVPLLATLVVAGSVFFSGVYAHGGAKDIDARYFYAAARCWAAGLSPYEPATYETMFRSIFGAAPESMFVYLPTLMMVVLPMAAFDWPQSALFFSLMNFAAAMALFWACYRLVRESLGTALRPWHWFWVVLGATTGGVAGTVFTGQTSVFVSAACAIALVGCQLQRPWLVFIGLVVASAKPHLSGPVLLFIAIFEPGQRRAVVAALAVVVAVFGYSALVDVNLVHSYLDSMKVYTSQAVNDPSKLTGLVALLLNLGVERKAAELSGATALLALLGFVAWILWRSRTQQLSRLPMCMMLLLLSTGLTRSVQGYDLCCYGAALALIATLGRREQVALVIPALILWRPGLVLAWTKGHPQLSSGLVATFAWLALLAAALFIAIVASTKETRAVRARVE